MDKLEDALQATRTWLESLVPRRRDPVPPKPWSGEVFWTKDEGWVFITDEDAEQYRRLLGTLIRTVMDDRVSPRAIELQFQRAILEVIDLPNRRSPDPAQRVDAALRAIRELLEGPPQGYTVVLPVEGLAAEGLPRTVGQVEFVAFDDAQLDRFRAAVTDYDIPAEDKRDQIKLIEEWGSEVRQRTVASVRVEALDWTAARLQAIREARLTLDVINFFSDLVPYNQAHLRFPGDVTTARMLTGQLREGPDWASYQLDRRRVGPVGELSFVKLGIQDSAMNLGFAYAHRLLGLGARRSSLQEQLIAGLQWAGRATVAPREEEAFLLYVIALESFLLPDEERGRISLRLRSRLGALLGSTAEDRPRIEEKVKELYDIRSQIVHSGHYLVTEADLALLRTLTKTSLIRMCTDQEPTQLSTPPDLVAWFKARGSS